MNREKIENTLINMGVPTGIKGFNYIADAVEYIDKHGTDFSITKELYPEIAKRRNATASRVERAIRHAFEIARSEKGDYETAGKYIGFMHCSSFNSLSMLHKKIKQECTEVKENKTTEPEDSITTLEIRKIVRQELKLALSELGDVLT